MTDSFVEIPSAASSTANRSVEVFINYAYSDEGLRNDLEKHLAVLKRQRNAIIWHDRHLQAGDERSREIAAHLESAQIILLLTSSDFITSDYLYRKSTTRFCL